MPHRTHFTSAGDPPARNAVEASRRLPPRRFPSLAALCLLIVASMLVAGCAVPAKPPPKPVSPLMLLPPEEVPDFCDDLSYEALAESATRSLAYLRRLPPNRRFEFGEQTFDTPHMIRSVETLLSLVETHPTCDRLSRNLRQRYHVYRAAGRPENGRVLFTGYYEPILMGSLRQSPLYAWPLYTRPSDLLTIDLKQFAERFADEQPLIGRLSDNRTVVPYYDRREIVEHNRLEGVADPLVWLNNRIDRFFLEIQGSGRIYLEGGGVLHAHYDGKNGRPYRSIGGVLLDSGKIPRGQVSMQSIRAYLEAHPDEMPEILYANPSFVFFKKEREGPLGALGVRLTPGRSLAVDRRLFPDAAPAFVHTLKPNLDGNGHITSWDPFGRFVFCQDTGGAIRGPGRADLFWGSGPYAEIAAGHLQHPGDLYLLVLKHEG